MEIAITICPRDRLAYFLEVVHENLREHSHTYGDDGDVRRIFLQWWVQKL